MSELEPERDENISPVESETEKVVAPVGESEVPEVSLPLLEAEAAPVAVGAAEAEPSAEAVVAPLAAEEEIAEPGAAVEMVGPALEAEAAEPAPEAAPAVLEERDDGRKWYVVHCYSGYENKVRHNLEQRIDTMGMKDKIFDVVVPTEEEIEVKEGKRRTVERRVFPGYILVQMILTEESWYVVRNTPGVTGFVGMGNDPTPLRPEEVAQIVKRMEAEAPRVKVTYKVGQKVRIIDGPFNDFIGTVADIDMERAKVRIMVSFFGRETPVELDFLQVEKA
jgi:transcriptional antiterminator NusG